MKTLVILFAALSLTAMAVRAQGDGSIASVQQTLKDQGFYYGEITGKKDADTTAAIRRYQIRNGLQITGELSAETRKSLGLKGDAARPRATAAPTAPPRQAVPRATPRQQAPQTAPVPPDDSDLRDDSLDEPEPEAEVDEERYRRQPPATGYAPGPRALTPPAGAAFGGTPFDAAPPEVQRRVIAGAQTLLRRQGYYRSGIDGMYGPGTEFAVRAYQSRTGLEPNGRLDLDTLASLGLLPGQQEPGMRGPRRRIWRRSFTIDPRGERVYIPR